MDKKHTLTYVVMLALLLAACARPQEPTSGIDWPAMDPADLVVRARLAGPTELQTSLSPDGRWLAPLRLVNAQRVEVYSTSDAEHVLETDLDPSMGGYLAMGPWAPDSKAFLLYSAEQGYSHCPFDQVILVHLDEQEGDLHLMPMDPHCAEPSPFVSASWSPDGERLAVTLNRRLIYILDRQARLQDTIAPELSGGLISGLWWTESGLLHHVGHIGEQDQRHHLRWLDPEHPQEQHTLFESATSLEIVGVHAGTGKVLLREQDMGYPPAPTFRLSVIDPISGEVERTHTVEGNQCVADPSPHPRFTPLKITQTEDTCTLWFYDWSRDKLKKAGAVTALVGWTEDAEDYVVLRGTLPKDMHFSLVRP